MYTKQFIQLVKAVDPIYGAALKKLSSLSVSVPLNIHPLGRTFYLTCESKIPKNTPIFSLSDQACLTNRFFADSPAYYQLNLTNTLEYMCPDYLLSDLTIALQIAAHSLKQQMRFHDYSKFILRQDNSRHPFYMPAEILIKIKHQATARLLWEFGELNRVVKLLNQQYYGIPLHGVNLVEVFMTVRKRAVKLGEVQVLAPMLDIMPYSLGNNCDVILQKTLFVQNQEVIVKAARDIQPGEVLTLNRGINNQLDLLIDRGEAVKNYPHTRVKLLLDYDEVKDYIQNAYEFKKNLLIAAGGIPEHMYVTRQGLKPEDWAILRIVLLTVEDITKNKDILDYSLVDFQKPISNENQLRVISFMIHNIRVKSILPNIKINKAFYIFVQNQKFVLSLFEQVLWGSRRLILGERCPKLMKDYETRAKLLQEISVIKLPKQKKIQRKGPPKLLKPPKPEQVKQQTK